MDLVKEKKANIVIAILDFILGIAVFALSYCYLYFLKEDTFNLKALVAFVSDYLKAANYKSLSTYVWLVFSFGPLVFGLIGLFGRIGRLPNVLVFASMVFSMTYELTFVLGGSVGKSIFDFASGIGISCFSICLIALIIGVILSFVNLEKSK